MASGTNKKKLKVVWICHFTNASIQNQLKPRKRINEFAPWITHGIKEVKKRPEEIELHLISPHRWINGIKEFQDKNVHYHFFNPGIPWYGRHWPAFFRWDIYTGYYHNRKMIKKITNHIKPDIVHWHGAENAYFCSSFLDLENKYPHFLTIQGFITMALNNHSAENSKVHFVQKNRAAFEQKILSLAKNIGVRDQAMKNEVLKYNENATFYWHEYFINIPEIKESIIQSKEKIYDVIYFTRIVKSKGIEDLIKAIGLAKKSRPEIKLAVLGNGESTYIQFLKELALGLNCLENVDFKGFIPTQEEIYTLLSKSRIFALPAYVGDVPGGMIESMVRKIPVITYKTGGIPEVNLKDINIEIVEQGDTVQLASRILYLLNNPDYSETLAYKAFHYAHSRWGNEKALDDIMIAYKTILMNQNNIV